jgi:hypothetical protein
MAGWIAAGQLLAPFSSADYTLIRNLFPCHVGLHVGAICSGLPRFLGIGFFPRLAMVEMFVGCPVGSASRKS